MITVGRSWEAGSEYRYGFNGMERDDEIAGNGNEYDFGNRIYNPRIGRWFKVDILSYNYPFASPYIFCLNSPITFIDPDGNEVIGTDGKPVNYEVVMGEDGKFTVKFLTQNIDPNSDAAKILNSLVLQSYGRDALTKMQTSTVKFKVENFHIDSSPSLEEHGRTSFQQISDGTALPKDPVITVYTNDDQFTDRMANLKGLPIEYYISAVASHEILGHTLDENLVAIDLNWGGAYGEDLVKRYNSGKYDEDQGFQNEFAIYFLGVKEYDKIKIDINASIEIVTNAYNAGLLTEEEFTSRLSSLNSTAQDLELKRAQALENQTNWINKLIEGQEKKEGEKKKKKKINVMKKYCFFVISITLFWGCSSQNKIAEAAKNYPQLQDCEKLSINKKNSSHRVKMFSVECYSMSNQFGNVYFGILLPDTNFIFNPSDSTETAKVYNEISKIGYDKFLLELDSVNTQIRNENIRRSGLNRY
ncbi:MAG: RHS repeat-associated core domain-containing protein [Chitinophagales bacterium]